MRTRLTILATLVVAAPAGAQPVVPAGTRIIVEAALDISGAAAARGARPAFRVAEPVVVGGDTVIRAGAVVHATVRDVVPAARYGKAGRLRVVFDSTRTVAGDVVPLDGEWEVRGSTRRPLAINVSVLSSGLGGLLVHGGDAQLVRCAVFTVSSGPQRAPARSTTLAGPAVADVQSLRACAPGEGELATRRALTKSPLTAVLLGFPIPGLGHRYAEDRRRGRWIMTVGMSGLVASATGFAVGIGGAGSDDLAVALFAGGGLTYAGTVVYAAVDAPRAVRRYNEALLSEPDQHRAPSTVPRPAGRDVRPVVRFVPAPRPGDAHQSAPAFGLRIR